MQAFPLYHAHFAVSPTAAQLNQHLHLSCLLKNGELLRELNHHDLNKQKSMEFPGNRQKKTETTFFFEPDDLHNLV